MKKAVSEFVGTYFLVLTVFLNVTGASLAGGFAAGATSIAITGTKLTLLPPNFGYTPALIGETFFTFVLCFTVLNVACTTMNEKLMGGGPSDQIYGWAIGMCIMVGAGATGNVSGACLNPAV